MKRKLVILGVSGLLAGLAACGWALFVQVKPPTLAVQAAFTPLPNGTNLYTGLVSFPVGGGIAKVRPEVQFQSRLGVVFLECPPFSNSAPTGAKASMHRMQFQFAVPSSVHRFRLGAEYEAPGAGMAAVLGRFMNLLPPRVVPGPVNAWLVRKGAWNVSRLEVFQDLWTTNTAGPGPAPSGVRGH